MFCEDIRIPGLPGEEDVTDGSVDWYEMDWENVENGVLESEMPQVSGGSLRRYIPLRGESAGTNRRRDVRNRPRIRRSQLCLGGAGFSLSY